MQVPRERVLLADQLAQWERWEHVDTIWKVAAANLWGDDMQNPMGIIKVFHFFETTINFAT